MPTIRSCCCSIKSKYNESQVPILTSQRRSGVLPTKQYPFEEAQKKEQNKNNLSEENQCAVYDKEYEEHIKKFQGIIVAKEQEVYYLKS